MAVVCGTAARSRWQSLARQKLVRRRICITPISTRRHESSSSSTTTKDSSSSFPWRHSADPLQRIKDGDNLSGIPIAKQRDTYFQEVLVGGMLRRDWFQLLFPSIWKESLASDCVWAFQKGLAALLSHTFQVPVQDIDKGDDGIVLDTENLGDNSEWTEEHTEESSKLVSQLFEEKLWNLYKHIDPSKLHLLLSIQPTNYRLEHVFSIIFSRDAIQKDEKLLEAGRNMRFASKVANDPLSVSQMLTDLDRKDKPVGLFSVICDVSIDCIETFQVKDKETGEIVSGSAEAEQVTHLVRFEVTTNFDKDRRLGQWRIVDWDDLLDGNVWY